MYLQTLHGEQRIGRMVPNRTQIQKKIVVTRITTKPKNNRVSGETASGTTATDRNQTTIHNPHQVLILQLTKAKYQIH